VVIHLPTGPGLAYLSSWAERNGVAGIEWLPAGEGGRFAADTGGLDLPAEELSAVRRHLSFMDLLGWVANGMEDVAFWDKPERWEDALGQLDGFFPPGAYDSVTTIEARGFVLAGVQAYRQHKPLIPVRKFREAFAALRGRRVPYVNWRGHADELWLQEMQAVEGRSVLFIDDVFETGNSMDAALTLLRAAGAQMVGAWFVYDASEPGVRERFGFPIRSLLRSQGLRQNTPPARQ